MISHRISIRVQQREGYFEQRRSVVKSTKEDLGHIFARFYKAKNSKESSLGIGLAFCKSIIRNQDGDIRVKSSKKEEDSWTEFTIKLYN